ncbi:MAG: site-specific DNA-methyltransferase [Candidatus Omnitrophica bacterium]|nr:site-specific DNA-methyltransferase [Candidatus Omnitrophota bacterium]
MNEIPDNSIQLIVTSPPYFNIKDYSKDGWQENTHSDKAKGQIGDINNYKRYIGELLKVWKECERILIPNGKLIINTPLMPMLKKRLNTHYNRHIFDINSDIEHSVINKTKLYLLDLYIWSRKTSTKKLMFGSYPFPNNFYAQNTIEFIAVYVKNGKPEKFSKEIKEKSRLTQKEWVNYTKQIWTIPIPNKKDLAFGKHSALMPEEIVRRCIKLFSFVGDIVLDPFAGSGTTLKIAKELHRSYVGYEICSSYQSIIDLKLARTQNQC